MMTVVVTRDVSARFRGFLASCMLEVAPGVYTSPRMTAGVRDRVWGVLEDWFGHEPTGSILMTWPDRDSRGGQRVATLGIPSRHLARNESVTLAWGATTTEMGRRLESLTTWLDNDKSAETSKD